MSNLINPDIGFTSAEECHAMCEKYGIVYKDRWERGTPHHPKAISIFELLRESDWFVGGDSFCWKSGGDGDNGETLKFGLSIYFELQDAMEKEKL